jgi:hypothetical protein
VDATVTVSVPGSGNKTKQVSYPSPLLDSSKQTSLLPMLLDKCTTNDLADLPPRVNISTASPTVLSAFVGVSPTSSSGGTNSSSSSSGSSSGSGTTSGTTSGTSTTTSGTNKSSSSSGGQPLTADDIQTILSTRPTPDKMSDPTYATAAWLVTDANLPLQTLLTIDTFFTGRSQVYRIQSVGYSDQGGPIARVEAVIDTNMGRPRIVLWRDLSELGRGFDLPRSGQ